MGGWVQSFKRAPMNDTVQVAQASAEVIDEVRILRNRVDGLQHAHMRTQDFLETLGKRLEEQKKEQQDFFKSTQQFLERLEKGGQQREGPPSALPRLSPLLMASTPPGRRASR